ncbi:MAG: pyridoxal-phosphate dependent enzyme [Candidatus Limnocylindrales bacterium]
MTREIALADIEAAAARIAGRIQHTPLLESRTAGRLVAERTGVAPGDGGRGDGQPRVFVKAEHLQVTGSFKPRGATNRVMQLGPGERRRGLIAASAGNHAIAVAYAGAADGLPVTAVMPEGASRAKAAAVAAYGARVVFHGAHFGDALAHARELAAAVDGPLLVHPYDDPQIIAGQGTVGLEILADLPAVDVIVVGAGGGGLVTGIASAVKAQRPGMRVYAVEPETSNALFLGVQAGRPVPVAPVSIADGLAGSAGGEWTIPLAARLLEPIVLVDEATIARGVRFALERMKQLLEPAGAAALGALLAGRIPVNEGETVAVVASGGNVDLARLPDILAMAGDADS